MSELQDKRNVIADAMADERVLAIPGACSMQPGDLMILEATEFGGMTDESMLVVPRLVPWKPRSDPTSWKGMDQTHRKLALEQLDAANDAELSVALEIGRVRHQAYLDLAAFAWVGSRTVGDLALKEMMVGNPLLPGGIKSPMDGNVDKSLDMIDEITLERMNLVGEEIARRFAPVLIFRSGTDENPQEWADSLKLAIDRTRSDLRFAPGVIVDVAHGSEIAHDSENKKSVEGQIAAFEHLLELVGRGAIDLTVFKGVMTESSNMLILPKSMRTDPNMPVAEAKRLISELNLLVRSKLRENDLAMDELGHQEVVRVNY